MEAAKEKAQKAFSAVDPSSREGQGQQQQQQPQQQQGKASSGLERDLEPKPTKVHLEQEAYVPSGKLKGKKALITGGDSGIGRSVAILFAMEGADVAIVYLPTEEADAQHTRDQVEKNGGRAELIASDLSSAANCKNVAERVNTALGGIDILVNNAATREEHQDITTLPEYVVIPLTATTLSFGQSS
jgi:predicted ATP-dependent serine protease